MLLNVERAMRTMDENGLDGLVATTLANVYYVSGLWSLSLTMFPLDSQVYAVVPRDELSKPIVVLPTGDLDTALACFPGVRLINFGTFYREVAEGIELTPDETRLKELSIDRRPRADALDGLVAALEEAGLTGKTIGLDEKGIAPSYPAELTKRFPRLKIQPAASIFRHIKMVKTAEEIRRLRSAAQVTESAILEAVGVAKEGVSEAELGKVFQRALVDQGAELIFMALRIGRFTAFGQVPPGETRLNKGDRIWFDCGCRYMGYSSDVMRTFVLGDPGARARRFYSGVLEAQERGLQAAKAGARAEDVFHAAMQGFREGGIPHAKRHHVGHGVGIDLYDPPLLAPGVDTVLEEGMVLNVETPYYEIGTGALGVEDTFVVTQGHPEFLTSISRELVILE